MSPRIENDADAGVAAADEFPTNTPLASAISRALPNACLLAAATGLMFTGGSALAATYQVTNTDDSGSGSLRDALNQANANPGTDTITFGANAVGTITLTTGSLPITDAVDIQGPGAAILTVDGGGILAMRAKHTHALTSSSNGNDFVVNPNLKSVQPNVANGTSAAANAAMPVTISGITITGGNASGSGGGIYAYHSVLTINNCVVTHNYAGGSGGGIFIKGGDGESYYSILNVNDSVVSANYAYYGGGGIAAVSSSAVTIQRSTVAYNGANGGDGGGEYGGGGIFIHSDNTARSLTISSSTVSGNRSYSSAGGGGVYIRHSSATITNSTISGNTAYGTGGGGVLAYFNNSGYYSTSINNSTITNNSAAEFGGGVFNSYQGGDSGRTSGTINLNNSVVSGNRAAHNFDISSYGNARAYFAIQHSLIQTPGSATITDNGGNQFNVDPMLGSLTNNGGPTLTQLPLAGSPLINAGDPAFSGLPYDQRGIGFPRIVGGVVDIGATEVAAAVPPPILEPAPDLSLEGKLGLGALLGLAGLAVARRRRNLGGGALGLLLATMLAAAPMSQSQAAENAHNQREAATITSLVANGKIVTVQLDNGQTLSAAVGHVRVVDKRSNAKTRKLSGASSAVSNTPAVLHVETNKAGKVLSIGIRLTDSLQQAQTLVAKKP